MDKWSRLQVADLGRVVTGRTPPGNDPAYYDGIVPFLTPSDMGDHRRVDRTVRSLSAHGVAQLARCLVTHGVGVSCIGWQMGKAVLIDRPTVTNQQINSVRRSELFNLGAGGSRTPILNKGDFERLPFMLPPLPEQRAIAHILGALDDKIELNRRINETLEAMARALFKSWFVDFDPVRAKAEGRDPGLPKALAELFPDSFEDSELGPVPCGWTASRWGELVSLEYGKALTGYDREDGAYAVYGTNGRIGTHSEALCPHPGIAVGRKGAYRGVHYCGVPFFVIDTAFYVSPKVPLEMRWAYYELLRLDINSMDSGSAIPSTSRPDFYGIPVLMPPVQVQECFVELLGPMWTRQAQNELESQTLASLRDTLLPKLISGELRVKDAERRIEETG